ncbi:MAG: polysaccharide export protein [Desulfobacteraceae bacterium]|nr:MAG: polysaccharide export protein [Desulfobacteraceae bacterium]
MKVNALKKSICTALTIGLLWATTGYALADETNAAMGDYQIGPGDVLEVSVWKNADLTKMVIVLPDGKISFPLVGRLDAAGKTVDQLSDEMRKRLNRYVPDADLSIIVAQVNSLMVYVIGRVNNPGRFVLNTNITVMQALAMAGGLNAFAKRGSIKIFREGQSGNYLPFDYDEAAKASNPVQDIRLLRGDVIVVP